MLAFRAAKCPFPLVKPTGDNTMGTQHLRNHGDTALRNLSTKVAEDDRELHQWQTHDGREVFGVDLVEQ